MTNFRKKTAQEQGSLKIFVGEQKSNPEEEQKAAKAKTGATFKTVESVQDMILLSSYIDVIRSTFGIPTSQELAGKPLSPVFRLKLRDLLLNNLPLLYSGIQNVITRCSKFYGSEFTKQVEDENIKILFDALGVKKMQPDYLYVVQKSEKDEEIRIAGRFANFDGGEMELGARNL